MQLAIYIITFNNKIHVDNSNLIISYSYTDIIIIILTVCIIIIIELIEFNFFLIKQKT